MAGFMAGFGQAFSRSFESQTERLEQRDAAEKARAFQERMAQIERDWALKMAERNESFQEKMAKERRRWDQADRATDWLNQQTRDTEKRKQDLFDTGLARRRELDDAKRVRAEKLSDVADQRKYESEVRASEREADDKTWTKRYGITRLDSTRDANTKRAQDLLDQNRSFERQKEMTKFQFDLTQNAEERKAKLESDRKIAIARTQAVQLAADLGDPEAVLPLFDRIVSQGFDTVEKMVHSGDFVWTKVKPNESTPATRVKESIEREAENLGFIPAIPSMTQKEAEEKGLIQPDSISSTGAFVRKEKPDTFGTLASAQFDYETAKVNNDVAGMRIAEMKIRAHTAARAIEVSMEAQSKGLDAQTIYIPSKGIYDNATVSIAPDGSKVYKSSLGQILDQSQFRQVSEFELKQYESLNSKMGEEIRKYNTSLNGLGQTVTYVGNAFNIARQNPDAMKWGGAFAEGATELTRNVLSLGSVIADTLNKDGVITEQTQSDISKFEAYVDELMSKETRTLAEDRALITGQLTLATFRTAGLLGQEGRNLSNIDYQKVSEVLSGRGNPSTLFRIIQDSFGPFASNLEVQKRQLLGDQLVRGFTQVYGPPPGLEIDSLENIIPYYGDNGKLGYDIVSGNVSYENLANPNYNTQTQTDIIDFTTLSIEEARKKWDELPSGTKVWVPDPTKEDGKKLVPKL